jgi:predicted enzyme related to lactoylglutathione lyase
MARRELFPIVNVDAIAPVQRFYETVFGASVEYTFPEAGEPVYVTLTIGESSLALGLGTGPAMYGQTPLPATGHGVDLCVYVPDLEAATAAAPAAGGTVVVSPTDTPWGERVAYLSDPQGTMVLVIQGD